MKPVLRASAIALGLGIVVMAVIGAIRQAGDDPPGARPLLTSLPTSSASPTPTVSARPKPSPSPTKPAATPKPVSKPKPKPPPPPPPPAADPIIAAGGDIACDPGSGEFEGGAGTATACRQRYTSNLLVARSYAAILALGDLQYEDAALSKFNASYQPSWGRVKSKTYPALGNHEYQSGSAGGYFSYFGSRAGSPSRGYYSYTVGKWHLIALNSHCGQVGGCHAGSTQEKWLRADLVAHKNKCTLAYWHHPRFSSGADHGSDPEYDAFWRALYDHNADVVLNGHDHIYERFGLQNPSAKADATRGIREFVVGTGGKDLDDLSSPAANSQIRHNQTFGILELTLKATTYSWKFRAEAGKTFTDSGSTSCH